MVLNYDCGEEMEKHIRFWGIIVAIIAQKIYDPGFDFVTLFLVQRVFRQPNAKIGSEIASTNYHVYFTVTVEYETNRKWNFRSSLLSN